jgi:hypothetical protein
MVKRSDRGKRGSAPDIGDDQTWQRRAEWRDTGSEVARLGGRITTRLEAKQSSLTIVAPAESCTAMIELLAGMVKEPELTVENLERTARLVDLREQRRGRCGTHRVRSSAGKSKEPSDCRRVTLGQVHRFLHQALPGRKYGGGGDR